MNLKLLVIMILLLFGCSNEKVFESKSKSFSKLIIQKENNEYYLSLKFTNNTDDTFGIYSIGEIRENSQKDTSKILNRILKDIIIEVDQNGHLTKSTDIDFDKSVLDNKIHELFILYPGSTYNLPISPSFDIRKEFSIKSNEFKVRAIFEPPIEFIKEDSLVNTFLRKYKNIKLINHKIETPFLRVE